MKSNDLPETIPDLEPGVTVLETPGRRSAALQQLVVSHLVDGDSRQAWWVDSGNAFATHSLYELAPGDHVLEHMQIARAFTAYQHGSLTRFCEFMKPASLPQTEYLLGDTRLTCTERSNGVGTGSVFQTAVPESAAQ